MMTTFLNIGTPELFLLIPALLWVTLFAIAFVKCLTNRQFTPTEKALWILVICVAPFFGALAYLIAYGKPKKRQPDHLTHAHSPLN